eukprot:359379-Chlamydomonas_euryale.AAC.4
MFPQRAATREPNEPSPVRLRLIFYGATASTLQVAYQRLWNPRRRDSCSLVRTYAKTFVGGPYTPGMCRTLRTRAFVGSSVLRQSAPG